MKIFIIALLIAMVGCDKVHPPTATEVAVEQLPFEHEATEFVEGELVPAANFGSTLVDMTSDIFGRECRTNSKDLCKSITRNLNRLTEELNKERFNSGYVPDAMKVSKDRWINLRTEYSNKGSKLRVRHWFATMVDGKMMENSIILTRKTFSDSSGKFWGMKDSNSISLAVRPYKPNHQDTGAPPAYQPTTPTQTAIIKMRRQAQERAKAQEKEYLEALEQIESATLLKQPCPNANQKSCSYTLKGPNYRQAMMSWAKYEALGYWTLKYQIGPINGGWETGRINFPL